MLVTVSLNVDHLLLDISSYHFHVHAEETNGLPREVRRNVLPNTSSPSSNITTTEVVNGSQSTPVLPELAKEVTNKPNYRWHDYYNTPTEVVLSIFAKGIPAKNVSLSVIIDIAGKEQYHLQPRLFGKVHAYHVWFSFLYLKMCLGIKQIIPDKCRFEVLPSKVEIHLLKAEAITWTSLEHSDEKTVPQKISTLPGGSLMFLLDIILYFLLPKQPNNCLKTKSAASKEQRPSYPSSKSKIDWDKLEAQVKKEEKEEKLDSDASLNKFFQEIYRDYDDDVRRAMAKSFVRTNSCFQTILRYQPQLDLFLLQTI
ncbi:hypothetical protein B296_00003736 [Ensete ventricosum]|uniref:SGS domain-containing protein n=1 Tax=Ensete ventricosum TaxID=4639 RepID=A0A427B7B8_ENSVE|nr:hypothetical protein B296_00003736 [Ensete ventricosum]